MPYFLDGNNLIGGARGKARPGEDDRAALVAELCDRLRATRARALLFFDGPGEAGAKTLGSLSIRGSGGVSADEAMLREIGRSAAPSEIVVVTGDRDLARRARDAGAKAMAPAEFWARFGASPRRVWPESPAPVDVEEWMRYFGDERNRK